MPLKPVMKALFVMIIMASALLVGCGGSGCYAKAAAGSAGACTGSGTGSGPGPGPSPGPTSAPTGPFTIGGSVVGLTATGLVLQDNGTDVLPITQNGSFTFKIPITGGGAYSVTIKTQPTGSLQPCSVSSGTGTATGNVNNILVTCGNTFTIGGTVSGLQGSGLVLLDNGGDNLAIGGSGNINFTFATPLAGGTAYAVTILTQPSNPGQTCSVSNGTGTATGPISNVQVVCPQTGFTIGGTLVGLVNGPGDTVELMNNGGDNIFVTGNNTPFVFPTPVTGGGGFDVLVFIQPTSQPQPCNIFNYTGIAIGNYSDVIVDCQHNDWTWMDGPNTQGNFGNISLPPPAPPVKDPNVPGGREFSASWTDSLGRMWVFGGFGLDVKGATPPDLPGLLNDLWLYSPGLQGWIPAALPITTTTVGAVTTNTVSILPDQTTDNPGGSTPGSRWGSVTWSDGSGNLWMFGGQGYSTTGFGLLNDIWKFAPGGYDVTTPPPPASPTHVGSYTELGTWTAVSGTATQNQAGIYPATVGTAGGGPGGRWGAAFTTDPAGANVWVFGGQGIDSAGNLGLLNDLWEYNIAGGTWTWRGPTNSNVGQNNGVYGTQGTPLAANAPGPGGRQAALLWADKAGNLWLFGGLGLDSVGTRNPGSLGGLSGGTTTPDGALLNDLWKYNIATGQWTWISGGGATGVADQTGVYGIQQTPAAGNVPSSRWGSIGFIDASNNLWLATGWGYASTLAQSTGYLNDVWEYQQSSGQWIWWKASSDVNQAGYFPSQYPPSYGVPFVKNTPGARFGAASWKQDFLFYSWIFGGEGFDAGGAFGSLDDLLRYLPFP